jgi:radical SAM protein (TIGR01212 family)
MRAGGFLAYFQAFSNTYGHPDRLRALYDEALRSPQVVGLSVGTRPDCLEEPILELLGSYARKTMVWLELGLQSGHDETLLRINRGHDFSTFCRAVREADRRKLLVCAHLILGLPGESRPEIQETARRIACLPLHGLKLHALCIVRGTAMETLHREGGYGVWTQAEYAEAVCDVLERIPPHWVIQRLTSDPDPRSLESPAWTLRKQETLRAIHRRLEVRDTWQGKLLGSPPPEPSTAFP